MVIVGGKPTDYKWEQTEKGNWVQRRVVVPNKGDKWKMSHNAKSDWNIHGFLSSNEDLNKHNNNIYISGTLDKFKIAVLPNEFKTSPRQSDYTLRAMIAKDIWVTMGKLWVRKVKSRNEKILLGMLGYAMYIIVVKNKGMLDNPNRPEYLVLLTGRRRKKEAIGDIDRFNGYRDPKFELDYDMLGII